jgi:hypothetical protein
MFSHRTHHIQDFRQRCATGECPFGRQLDGRSIGHRVGERDAEFDDVCPGAFQFPDYFRGGFQVWISSRDEGYESFLVVFA